jgi:hypothetical protein
MDPMVVVRGDEIKSPRESLLPRIPVVGLQGLHSLAVIACKPRRLAGIADETLARRGGMSLA